MSSSLDEILSLLWIAVKQKEADTGSIEEETFSFYAKELSPVPPKKPTQPTLPQTITPKRPLQSCPPPEKPQAKPTSPPTKVEEPQGPPVQEPSVEAIGTKHEKLLPKTFSFVPLDTFQTRKKILAVPHMPSLRDGCLYETPEHKSTSWAFFSFPLPPQEKQFLDSALKAVGERLNKRTTLFSCLDETFGANLRLTSLDSEKLFFFIEPHNESQLRTLLEGIPEFSPQPPKEVDPFLSLGSIHGNPLHLFLVTPSSIANADIKSRLWMAFKKLALGSSIP